MFAGIDTHKDTLAVAVVDLVGLPVVRVEEPNTRAGFVRIGELLATHQVTRVGIEGSGSYGRCVAAYLVLDWDQSGVAVLEVPTVMTSRERGARPGKGKTDPVDAVAIARITMREPDLPPVRLVVGDAADLRALLDYRDDLVTERGDLVNRVHMDLHGMFPGYHHQIPDLIRKTHLDAAQLLLADDHRVRAEVTRRRLARIVAIDVEAGALKHRIAGLVADTGSSLTGIYGVGPIIAARFMAEVALDAVGSDVVGPDPLPLTPSCDALQVGTPHQQLDLVVSDLDAAPESEFGMDPAGTVDPVALVWIWLIRSVSIACRSARSEGGRVRRS